MICITKLYFVTNQMSKQFRRRRGGGPKDLRKCPTMSDMITLFWTVSAECKSLYKGRRELQEEPNPQKAPIQRLQAKPPCTISFEGEKPYFAM